MGTLKLALGTFVLSALAAPAWAQAPTTEVAADPTRAHLLTRNGMAATVGVGATNFFDQNARDLMSGDVGAYADVRLIYGTRSFVGAEAAYNFSGRALSTTQFSGDAPTLFGHGLEGLLRLNYPMHTASIAFSPFVVGGLGWTAFLRTDEQPGSTDKNKKINVRQTDHVGTIPVGAGFAASWRVIYLEARFMYRPTYGESGIADNGKPGLDAWFAGLHGGMEF
ncbi:MAG TPA: hypothetical protein VN914_21360 [Polyangia bacterium]|nr:hypothetical protein [Polyangia bacterium]